MRRAVGLALGVAAACAPTFDDHDALVTSPRVLAVRSDPAEVTPEAPVTLRALVAGPTGTVSDAAIEWSFCTAPKPVTEDNVVSSACLGSSALVPAGTGPSIDATLPAGGCSIFGPDVSAVGLRPRDPDATGGYYQPVRASLAGSGDAFARVRIRCNLAQADGQTATAFASTYVPNRNPVLRPLTATVGGASVDLGAIPRGVRVALEVGFTEDSAERYAYFDPGAQVLTTRRESLRVAWHATAGAFDVGSTGRTADDPGTTTSNAWTAPSFAQTVHLWIVLRDSRGGVDYAGYEAIVR